MHYLKVAIIKELEEALSDLWFDFIRYNAEGNKVQKRISMPEIWAGQLEDLRLGPPSFG